MIEEEREKGGGVLARRWWRIGKVLHVDPFRIRRDEEHGFPIRKPAGTAHALGSAVVLCVDKNNKNNGEGGKSQEIGLIRSQGLSEQCRTDG